MPEKKKAKKVEGQPQGSLAAPAPSKETKAGKKREAAAEKAKAPTKAKATKPAPEKPTKPAAPKPSPKPVPEKPAALRLAPEKPAQPVTPKPSPEKPAAPKPAPEKLKPAPEKPAQPAVLPPPPPPAVPKIIELPASITVRELAERFQASPIDVIKHLMKNGIMVNINQLIDYETAAIVAGDMGFEVKEVTPAPAETPPAAVRKTVFGEEKAENLLPRPPVVTVMGHVDHGKTSLLDAIRQTSVAASEAGGITQHIGAYQVVKQGRKITFIDTPGHEAFTAMRARGAKATDVAILVIAADDGVMPQTIEALEHARAAQVPIVVAITKIDKENANVERVKQQISDIGLMPEDWGGQTVVVPVSLKSGQGITDLLEMILLVSDMEELRANPKRRAVGTVIEGKLDKTRGPMATMLVRNGTLRLGDVVMIDEMYGRVRAMFDDHGKTIKSAGPATPTAILGLPQVPTAGEPFEVVPEERQARAIVTERAAAKHEATVRPPKILSLDDLYAQIQTGAVKELNIVLKVDAQGSLDPIQGSLEKLGDENLHVRIIRHGTGNITESDVNLAVASKAIVIGFNVQIDPAARPVADHEGIDIRQYQVIYELIEDVERALKGLTEPVYQEVIIGHAQVLQIFRVSKRGKVAGVKVTDGLVTRNALARIRRNGEMAYEGRIDSLKRFTEDVKEITAGFECGIGLADFDDFKEGDIIEFYKKEKVEA